METEMKRLVLQAQIFPLNLRNIELRYKLSDWELARTKIPIQLPIRGYIQSQHNYSIDIHNLNQWFHENWSPVENQLRRDKAYLAWVEDDPAYRHVHRIPSACNLSQILHFEIPVDENIICSSTPSGLVACSHSNIAMFGVLG